jgi:ParB family transcriptional regulator, chromosome partitioning protein
MTRNALGRGLGALIREPEAPPSPLQPPAALEKAQAPPTPATIPYQIDIDLIEANPYQPRTRFREEALEELARSIRASGIIQPLLLRRAGVRFQLLAGERRWRAAQRAGLHKVPAILMDVPEDKALEITLVENLQREDLNPIEEARAYQRLLQEFHMTHEEVAERTGKERTTISNAVRLLRLERPLLELLEDGKLSAGQGRALLGIEDGSLRVQLAHRAVRRGMTVRQLERFAARRARNSAAAQSSAVALDPNTKAAVNALAEHLGTRVMIRLKTKAKPGAIIIEYYDDDQLAAIYDRIVH